MSSAPGSFSAPTSTPTNSSSFRISRKPRDAVPYYPSPNTRLDTYKTTLMRFLALNLKSKTYNLDIPYLKKAIRDADKYLFETDLYFYVQTYGDLDKEAAIFLWRHWYAFREEALDIPQRDFNREAYGVKDYMDLRRRSGIQTAVGKPTLNLTRDVGTQTGPGEATRGWFW